LWARRRTSSCCWGLAVKAGLRRLTPQDDAQRQLLAQAQEVAREVSQSRWMLIEEGQNELPNTFLVVLVLWLTLLFVSFGSFARAMPCP
jgi:hypothetical protein